MAMAMALAAARSSDDIGEAALPAGNDLDAFEKTNLVDTKGRKFRDLRRELQPKLGQVWRHILAGHAVLDATAAGLFVAQAYVGLAGLALVPVGALVIGYTIAYIQLFFHGAAHYNIAWSRKTNDLLAARASSRLDAIVQWLDVYRRGGARQL